jgi:hypothetical protein
VTYLMDDGVGDATFKDGVIPDHPVVPVGA